MLPVVDEDEAVGDKGVLLAKRDLVASQRSNIILLQMRQTRHGDALGKHIRRKSIIVDSYASPIGLYLDYIAWQGNISRQIHISERRHDIIAF